MNTVNFIGRIICFQPWFRPVYGDLLVVLALLIGAVVGYYVKIRKRIIGCIMAFGAGVLIAAACFELLEQAFEWGGYDSTILGFVAGVVIFTLVDLYLSRTGAKHRKTADKSIGWRL